MTVTRLLDVRPYMRFCVVVFLSLASGWSVAAVSASQPYEETRSSFWSSSWLRSPSPGPRSGDNPSKPGSRSLLRRADKAEDSTSQAASLSHDSSAAARTPSASAKVSSVPDSFVAETAGTASLSGCSRYGSNSSRDSEDCKTMGALLASQAVDEAANTKVRRRDECAVHATDWYDDNKRHVARCNTIGLFHVSTFDNRNWNAISAVGTWWLVKTSDSSVSIQAEARRGHASGAASVHGIAISGSSFLNHRMTIRPSCTWNYDDKVCDFQSEDGLPIITLDGHQLSHADGSLVVPGQSWEGELGKLNVSFTSKDSVQVHGPRGVEMNVTFLDGCWENTNCTTMNVHIFMRPLTDSRSCWVQQCGFCGTFDGNHGDDFLYFANGTDNADNAGGVCAAKVASTESLFHDGFLPTPIDGNMTCSGGDKLDAETVCVEAFDENIGHIRNADVYESYMEQCIIDLCLGANNAGQTFYEAFIEDYLVTNNIQASTVVAPTPATAVLTNGSALAQWLAVASRKQVRRVLGDPPSMSSGKAQARYMVGTHPTRGKYATNNGCPRNYQEIDSDAECNKAYDHTEKELVIDGSEATYSTPAADPQRIGGCIWYKSGNEVKFNTEPSPVANDGDFAVICKLAIYNSVVKSNLFVNVAQQNKGQAQGEEWHGIKWVAPTWILESVEGANLDDLMYDDGKSWRATAASVHDSFLGTREIIMRLKIATTVTGIRVKQPQGINGCAFRNFKIEYALDEDEQFWRLAKEGEGGNQECCEFQEINFGGQMSQSWKFIIESTWSGTCASLQYIEFHAIGTGTPPGSHESDPWLLLPGAGKCTSLTGSQDSNFAWDYGDTCRTKCAEDPGCPGFTAGGSPKSENQCIWYTDIYLDRAGDYDFAKRAEAFDMRFASPNQRNREKWATARCFRKATPCPMNSQGYNVQQGCICNPGFSGRVTINGERPWYVNTCERAPCPANSELLGGLNGICTCDPGYGGLLLNTQSPPFHAGECAELGNGVWLRSTTTTTFPGGRYWGLAIISRPEDGKYQPHSFRVFTSKDGTGQDLARNFDFIGVFPKDIENKTYEPKTRNDQVHFLSLESEEAGGEGGWSSVWSTFRKPIFYVDLQQRWNVRSVKTHCNFRTRCPNKFYVVSSEDLITWYPRLYSDQPQEALVAETVRQKARYWGVAGGRISESHIWSPMYLDLFQSIDGTGTNLAQDLDVTGQYPTDIASQTFRMRSSQQAGRGNHKIHTFNVQAGEEWYLSWVQHKLPNFYVDLGDRYHIQSARLGAEDKTQAPDQVFVVSSDDLINWRAQFVTNIAEQEVLLDQKVAKCTNFICPNMFRPKDEYWDLTCNDVSCHQGSDRDECCEPYERYTNPYDAVKIDHGGGWRIYNDPNPYANPATPLPSSVAM